MLWFCLWGETPLQLRSALGLGFESSLQILKKASVNRSLKRNYPNASQQFLKSLRIFCLIYKRVEVFDWSWTFLNIFGIPASNDLKHVLKKPRSPPRSWYFLLHVRAICNRISSKLNVLQLFTASACSYNILKFWAIFSLVR